MILVMGAGAMVWEITTETVRDGMIDIIEDEAHA